MIRIKRPRKGPPALLKKGDDKKTERQRAIAFYENPKRATDDHFTDFSAYSDWTVKKALRSLFHKKCAYCEKLVPGRLSADIEHYRPKGAVKIGRKRRKPGYYWLAASWSNLLLSCKDCNSPAEQEIANGTKRTIGKHEFFPTYDDWNASSHKDRRREKPLIADPCREDPSPLFTFLDDGNIRVKADKGLAQKKAEETIRILGLDRLDLMEARRDWAVLVNADLTELRIAVKELNKKDSPANQRRVKRFMKKLAVYLEPQRPFLALTRSMVRSFFKEHGLPVGALEPHLK